MTKTRGESHTWAIRDRSIISPQRAYARMMRADPTDAEQKLWRHMRHRLSKPGTHFRRQVQIGRYIADFASHKAKLIVEVDGGQHIERAAYDTERTRMFEANGYRVLRYWNNDVLANIDGVLEDIQRAIAATPTPNPSPQGGGEKRPSPPLRGGRGSRGASRM